MQHLELAQETQELLNKSLHVQEETERRLRRSIQSSQESSVRALGEQQEDSEQRLQAEMARIKLSFEDRMTEFKKSIVSAVNGAAVSTGTQFQNTMLV